MFLRGKKQSLLKIYQKEMATAAKEHRFEQAAEIRNKIFALQHLNQVASIKSDQDNPIDLNRIEAYDIANISGQLAVGSMVVWENGDLDKDEYRKFKIKTVDGSNDVAMIKEVVARRLRNDWPEPDLMIIDGGQGQFNAAKQALVEANLNYKLLSIAKGPDRKKDEFISDDPNIIKLLNQNNVLKNQILELRNEAHRFAQSYFHQRQLKKMIE
jgi:excinuclease ABC subunit C